MRSRIDQRLAENAVCFGVTDARQDVKQVALKRRADQQARRAQCAGFAFGGAQQFQAGTGVAIGLHHEEALAYRDGTAVVRQGRRRHSDEADQPVGTERQKRMKETGLSDKQIEITDDGLQALIEYYTREAGVRNLEREVGNLCRKVAVLKIFTAVLIAR